MNNKNLHLGVILVVCVFAFIAFSCKKENEEEPGPQLPRPIKEIEGVLKGHTTLYEDTIYVMTDRVWVPEASVLTIQPGTIIKALKDQRGSLIIERGAQIYAEGTKEKPIVFTSAQEPGNRQPGDWGAIYIAGKAPTSRNGSEVPGGLRILYGGDDPDDNSGVFRYVRIEYAGRPEAGDVSYGLVLAGVGSGTTIEFVQVNSGLDIGFQWFGGTVNCKYLVANRNVDATDFNMDNGFNGMVQFALIVKENPILNYSHTHGVRITNGDATATSAFTTPHISNLTYIGTHSRLVQQNISGDLGCQVSQASGGSIINSAFVSTYLGTLCLWESFDTTTFQQSLYPFFIFQNNVIAEGMPANYPSNGGDFSTFIRGVGFSEVSQQLKDKFYNHNIISNYSEMGIGPFTGAISSSEKLLPTAASILFSPSVFPAGVPSGSFKQVNFLGAFGKEDWTKGWVSWDPQETVYE